MEALLSVVIVGYAAVVLSGLYMAGLQASNALQYRVLMDAGLRSQMEELIATHFDQLASGSQNINIEGTNHVLVWTVANIDLDGDGAPENAAKLITLTLDARTFTTIVADHQGRLGKV